MADLISCRRLAYIRITRLPHSLLIFGRRVEIPRRRAYVTLVIKTKYLRPLKRPTFREEKDEHQAYRERASRT
jgi:hypothetical protein